MSDDPERNGITQLDEMMLGVVRSILDQVACFLYCICITFTVLQIVGPRAILIGLFMLPGFIVSWRPG